MLCFPEDVVILLFFFSCTNPPMGQGRLIEVVYRSHITTTTVSRTPLNEGSARRTDLYLTTHNNHNRQISITRAGFEPTISVGERPQTYAFDRAATGASTSAVTPS